MVFLKEFYENIAQGIKLPQYTISKWYISLQANIIPYLKKNVIYLTKKNGLLHKYTFGLRHEISNNVVCATSKVRHAVRSETLLYSHLNIL